MRILDCKVDHNSEVLLNAPKINDFLTDESKEYFNKILKSLDVLKIPYETDENLVRGLDYYTDTVFEFVISDSSELNGLAICAGGKYAELIKGFGGPDIPGVGYAFGLERIVSVMEKNSLFPNLTNDVDVVIISLDEDSKIESLKIANELRDLGFNIDLDYKNFSFKPQFKLADRDKCKYIMIIGEEERKSGIYTIKDVLNKTEDKLSCDEIVKKLNN